MKKSLLSAFVMLMACCGVANAAIDVSSTNVAQPANDTLLFALPITPGCSQEIWTSYTYSDGSEARFMKFQPEYLVSAEDFTHGDTNLGTATLPANAKVIALGLKGFDIGSDVTNHGIYHEATAWCRNIPADKLVLDYLDLFDGYRTHLPQGELCTDTVTYRGYYGRPGVINTFNPEATADNPDFIVDIPFGNPDDPNMPFWYKGENIYLTMWLCNWSDVHMKYHYMAYDNAEAEYASLMRTGNLCFDNYSQDYIFQVFGISLMYDLPKHRLPAFQTPYYTNDIRVNVDGYPTIYQLRDADNNVIEPAEDGNYYGLDHTMTYYLKIGSSINHELIFEDIYKDIDILVQNFTAVEELDANKTVANVAYYNLAGQQSAQPVDGVNIVVTTYTDGSTTTAKVIK